MKFKTILFYVFTFLMCIACVVSSFAQEQEKIHLNFGTGSNPQSGNFPYHVAVWQLFDAAEGVRVSMTIPGGSVTGAMEVLRRDIDIAGGLDISLIYQMVNGLSQWENNPMPNDLRVLGFMYEQNNPIVVTLESNINSLKDLEGKTYSFGFPGWSSQMMFDAAIKALGLNITNFTGAQDDAIIAMRDGRIPGFAKSCPRGQLDASLMDIMFQKPIKVIGFSEEDVLEITEKLPYLTFRKIPENYYPGVENLETYELAVVNAWVCHKDLPEDVIYEVTKSYVKGWKEQILDVFGPAMATHNPNNTPELISSVDGVFLHSGSLRYYKEIGANIPDSVIPPESR